MSDDWKWDSLTQRIVRLKQELKSAATEEEAHNLRLELQQTMDAAAGLSFAETSIARVLLAPTADTASQVPEIYSPDDPVRRDREGWQAGIKAAIGRLQDDITDWHEELKLKDITPEERSFIFKRVGQISTHIAQIRELKYLE